MSRKCTTCQHIQRAEVDRRLAAGEPSSEIARDYGINPSSLHRHRANCLKLASSSAIMKETARGTAAVACLPTRDELGTAYAERGCWRCLTRRTPFAVTR
jgi:transposase-like protein